MSDQTPRVNAPLLSRFVDRTVRIIGKVTELHGDKAVIDASGPITLALQRDNHLTVGHGVELIGKVQPGLDVRVQACFDIGTNVDYTVADAVVDATHRYKELFYDSI